MTCKVCTQIEQYGITADLEAWYDDDDDDEDLSLRDVADRLNARLLQEAYFAAGSQRPLSALEAHYEHLYGKNASDEKEKAKTSLREAGLDPKPFARDPAKRYTGEFVSYGTVRKHFNKCLGVDTSREWKSLTPAKAIQQSDDIVHRNRKILEENLVRLADDGLVRTEIERLDVEITVSCGSCHRRWSYAEFVDAGGCSQCCSEEGEEEND
ncbi:rod-determining factor RdfA [Natronosalvus vescus]|uniref:rod-determining factor RdfA n=1 Tax=Natronosalvus vescus TaxID=2953881 RepID=UPI00209182C2|nr:rod-determining factor RdfA [Natronosalvus vescus]